MRVTTPGCHASSSFVAYFYKLSNLKYVSIIHVVLCWEPKTCNVGAEKAMRNGFKHESKYSRA